MTPWKELLTNNNNNIIINPFINELGLTSSISNINNIVELTKNFKDGNKKEIIQSVLNLVPSIFNLCNSWTAKEDISISNNKIKTASGEIIKAEGKIQKQIIEMINSIKAKIDEIEKILDTLNKENEKVKEKQEKLKEYKQIIDNNIQIFNDDNSTPSDKNKALKDIRTNGIAIQNLADDVLKLKNLIDEQNNNVKESTETISNYQKDAITNIVEELRLMENIKIKVDKEGNNNIKYEQQGAQEIAAGSNQIAEAQVLKLNTATLQAGIALEQRGNDNIQAGNTHATGGANNLTEVATTLNSWGSSFSTISALTTEVATAVYDANKVANDYNTQANIFNTTISKWENVKSGVNKLNTALDNFENNDKNESTNNTVQKFNFDTNIFIIEETT